MERSDSLAAVREKLQEYLKSVRKAAVCEKISQVVFLKK